MKTKITAALLAPVALTACNPFPYAKQHHVTIQEIEASSVTAEPGVELGWCRRTRSQHGVHG